MSFDTVAKKRFCIGSQVQELFPGKLVLDRNGFEVHGQAEFTFADMERYSKDFALQTFDGI